MKKILFAFILLMFCHSAICQWESNPSINNQITVSGVELLEHYVVSYGEYTYIMYITEPLTQMVTKLQILDGDGVAQFPNNGITISSGINTPTFTVYNGIMMTVDKAGNAVIAVSDLRRGGSGNNTDYTIYKVAPDGTMLWGPNGVQLHSTIGYYPAEMQMIHLSNGNHIFAWFNMSDGNVMLQCLSSSGTPVWTSPLTLGNGAWGYPYLVESTENSFIMFYSQRTSYNFRYSTLKAQKYNANGVAQWTSPVTIYDQNYTLPNLQSIFNVESDGMGGGFVAWYDAHVNSSREDVYIAHIDMNGNSVLTSGMTQRIGNNATQRSFRPILSADPTTQMLYVIWQETNANQSYQEIKIQKLSYTGTEQWASSGILLGTNSGASAVGYQDVSAIKNGNGQVGAFWMRNFGEAATANTESYVTLLDAQGNYVWPQEKINFTTLQNNRFELQSTDFINDHWIAYWTDARNGELFGNPLYLQRINVDGTLGAATVIVPPEECNTPVNLIASNITQNSALLSWNGDSTNLSWTLFYKSELETEFNTIPNISENQYLMENLSPYTIYYWAVQANCNDTISNISTTEMFATLMDGIQKYNNENMNVFISNNNLHIQNPDFQYINKVQIFNTLGQIIKEYNVSENHSFSISVSFNDKIVFVRILGNNINTTYKIIGIAN
jgi:hypothetical protein